MTEFVEFRFQNLGYDLIDEAKNEVYVNIERVVRTKPYNGMKQPTPVGGTLGIETVMAVKYRGDAANRFRWELHERDIIYTGTTDEYGMSHIPIKVSYSKPKHFTLKIFIGSVDS
jgi:hypothetical protein